MLEAYVEAEMNGEIRPYPITKQKFTIGRLRDRDLCFNFGDVSRDHAVIEYVDARFVLRDCESRYGTYVNERRVSIHILREGDWVRVGPSSLMQFVFHLGPAPRDEKTQPIVEPASALHQITLLLDGLRAMGSGRGLEEVLAIVVDSAIELTGAERGFVMLANASGVLDLTLGRTRDKETIGDKEIVTSRSIPEWVFREGLPRYESDLLQSGHRQGPTMDARIRSVLCVPLRLTRIPGSGEGRSFRARTFGVLYVDSNRPARFMTQSARAALDALADEAALTIQLYKESIEKLRVEHDLQAAAEVQKNLFPEQHGASGPFDVAGKMLPCLTVGGDFMDYVDAADDLFVFAQADVSGKGLPAAILAAKTQGIFSTGAPFTNSPGQLMTQINRALSRRPMGGKFVTMACAALAPDGRLVSSCAGHNPPLVLRKDGTIETLEEGGLPLGILDCAYQEQSTYLAPGEVVILYSDGVNECADALGDFFGMERVQECLHGCRDLGADDVVDRLFAAVRDFSGDAAQGDDITVLAVRYLGDRP